MVKARDAINRRLYKGLIIVKTAIYRVFAISGVRSKNLIRTVLGESFESYSPTLVGYCWRIDRGSNPSAPIHLNFFNFSAFQRTLAISPQFIAGPESNALGEVLGLGGLTPQIFANSILPGLGLFLLGLYFSIA